MPTYNPYFQNYPTNYNVGQTNTFGGPINYTVPANQTNPVMINNPIVNNGIIWVQGEAGAKAYPVAAGGSVLLMDSENEKFYIKSTDNSGVPMPLRIFKYEEIMTSKEEIIEEKTKEELDLSNYVTKDELDKRLNSFNKNSKYENKRDRKNIDE